jgi:hypothetical protein
LALVALVVVRLGFSGKLWRLRLAQHVPSSPVMGEDWLVAIGSFEHRYLSIGSPYLLEDLLLRGGRVGGLILELFFSGLE